MTFDFSELAAKAVSNNNNKGTNSSVPSYLLPLEEARKAVKIKDGNKIKKEDGSQALTLTLGRITLALDVIAPKATRVNAAAEDVEKYTAMLQEGIDEGAFDTAILDAQEKANPANKVTQAKAALEQASYEGAPAGVDLEELS